MNKTIGLYIHIPFCKAKCHYCDFNSHAGMELSIPAYTAALCSEIAGYSTKLQDYSIKTIFIGGGTPSLLDAPYTYEIMKTIRNSLNVSEQSEITIEANPGTVTFEKLLVYRAAGINRISMGLQAWQDELLKRIGRIHTRGEFLESMELVRKAGFRNINLDLIFGLPGQTMKDWEETLNKIIELSPSHVSCYSLLIEEGTVFGDMEARGELSPVDEELDRQMYWTAVNKLEQAGYRHYEISNFAKPGKESRHNLIYWKAEEYLGIGTGAHSYLEGKRFNNTADMKNYINDIESNKSCVENIQEISQSESMSEYMILGLRLIDGVNIHEFKSRFGKSPDEVYGTEIKKLAGKQLIELSDNAIRLTETGLDLANQVFVEFI